MDRCPATCFPPAPEEPKDPMLGYLLPSLDWEEQYDNLIEAHYEGIDVSHHVLAHAHSYLTPVVGRTTVSTSLAKNAAKDRFQGIPLAFRKYKKVFSDKEAQQLPQHRPWDHKIDLIPGGQMAKTTVYQLTPPEKVALREYIDDGLKRGTLQHLEAPDACSFFFINKKDGKLHPVQDYRPLNTITRKNAAPIPLIPKLIDKLLGARFFTKLDVRWGYNNIHIQAGDKWKTAFKTPMGLYKSLVVMIQPPFFIFHPLLKSLPLRHPHQSLSQHVYSKHQFDASPLPTSPCRPHHRLWIYVHPVHLTPPSLTSCLRQTSLTSRTHTCRPRPVPPKPSTFGKPSTMPRSTPLRPEIEPHHRCLWKPSQPASHVVAKHATPPPRLSHLPRAVTVHHQKPLVHAATPRIPTTTARTLPTRSTNTTTGKHTVSISCRHPRIGPL